MTDVEEGGSKPLSVYEILGYMLDQAATVAWQKLGLQHDAMTGQMEMNLVEARVAIDTVSFLVTQIEPQLDDEDKRRVQTIVRDLRINYVQKSGG